MTLKRAASNTPHNQSHPDGCPYCNKPIIGGGLRIFSWVYNRYVHWDCYVLKEMEQNEQQSGATHENKE